MERISLELQEFSSFAKKLCTFEAYDGWIGVLTNGDGACGLHALFGVPNRRAELHCEDARQQLVQQLPPSWSALQNKHDVDLERAASKVLDQMWEDAVKSVQSSNTEGSIIVSQLPVDMQRNLEHFVSVCSQLREERIANTENFRMLAQKFFVPEHEEQVVRPLALSLLVTFLILRWIFYTHYLTLMS